ncbi:MAG: acetyl/propionyl/methylcrotonyl-CoA carboxylase subunit alpha [Acidimicrobiia bacterium]
MIRRVLVANRGEIARRVFRTCREMRIETVAVYSDADATEPFVAEADIAVNLPGTTAADTYLDVEAIVVAAKESGADAVHPGYGFLAEHAGFARRVLAEGLTWIGPPPSAIETMGSKLASKAVMDSAGVNTLPAVDLTGLTDTDAADAAAGIGYPVLVKASAGGGGKGMRIVRAPEVLADAVEGARRESASSFGDDTVFLEQYLEAPRHIEIQVFGDNQGRVISLFERECSIQRRHQKIIEEAPAPMVDDELRARMGETAVAAARAVGYVGAGTVEFLFQDGEFFFLEMNTRLQVEHPVTEMITGLDLVRLQVEVANGEPLDIEPTITGHAIEARLYAEDAAHDFLPVTGTLHRFAFPDLPGLRIDSGVEDGSVVTSFYDPLLAKVICHARSREQAARTLATALRLAVIHGSVTNRALLVRILEDDGFLAGMTDTHFLERHDPVELARPLVDETVEHLAAVAAALSDQVVERSRSMVLATLPSGWRNNPGLPQTREYRGQHRNHRIEYRAALGIQVGGLPDLEVSECTPAHVELITGGANYRFVIARYGEARYLESDRGPVRLAEIPRFPRTETEEAPGSLRAPMPGQVLRLDVEVGDRVAKGQVLLVLEAMKMEHALRAPHDGTVIEIDAAPGDQIEAGVVLVVVAESSTSS